MYCNQGFKNIICSKAIFNKYVYWFLKSKKIFLNSLGRGATFKEISKSIVENIELFIPAYKEQVRIASLLERVHGIISLYREQLQKFDELVKARFVEMFGNPAVNSMKWDEIPLKECLYSIDNGKSFVCANEPRRGDWPAILKLSAVTYGDFRPKENKSLLKENQYIEKAAVQAEDLLFTRKNTPELVGMAAYVKSSPKKLMLPDLIFRLNTKENCSKIFLCHLINHKMFREKIQNLASGSAKSMSNISKERLLNLNIIYRQ